MAADEQGREELHDEAPIEDVEGHKPAGTSRTPPRRPRTSRGTSTGWASRTPRGDDDVEGHKRGSARRLRRRRRRGAQARLDLEDSADDTDDVEGHKNRIGIDSDDEDDVEGHKNRIG